MAKKVVKTKKLTPHAEAKPANVIASGFKKQFSQAERAEIKTKRGELRARLYAAG